MGLFDTLFGGGAEKKAAEQNRGLLSQYETKGLGYLDKGFAGGSQAIDQAYQPLAALGQKYGGASSLLLDSYGVNGAEGNQRAQGAFQEGPQYDWQRNQALDAVERRRATGGMWNSGNNDLDLMNTASGLAAGEYDKWRSGLSGFVNPELSATQGAGQAKMSLADLYNQDAQGRTNIGGSVASGGMSANNMEAAGKAAGAKNLFGGALSLASLGANSPGMFSSIGNAFGFGGKPPATGPGGRYGQV